MAGFRTIPALVLEAGEPAAALERLAERLARAPAAVARHAADLILLGRRTDKEVRIATCSRSLMVETTLVAVAARTSLMVSCAEGRPALEGRALAEVLAGRGIAVELYSDAGSARPLAPPTRCSSERTRSAARISSIRWGLRRCAPWRRRPAFQLTSSPAGRRF